MAGPVVHVISDAGPHGYFRTLIGAGGLDPAGVVVGCVGPAGALQADMAELGVASFALGARSRAGYLRASVRLARLLRRLDAPVVQTHLVDGCLVGLAAARLARVPVAVMTAHHSHELPYHGRRLRWPERLCTGPLCDHIIAPSRQVADTLVGEVGVPPGKLTVIHHGFDLAWLDPARADGARARAELGLEGCVVFGAIGRLTALKNHAALIEAFGRALGDRPEARLVIVGAGDPRPLRDLAGACGLGDRVVLAAPRRDIPDLLAACDVFIHPAVAESFGMVIVEAMAMARPVLSTPVGIAPEVLGTPGAGLLLPGSSPRELAAGLADAWSLREHWPDWGERARARVAGFTAPAMAQAHLAAYAAWLGER